LINGGTCLAEGGTAIGAFTHARTSMPSGTLIHYTGYATNSVGTGYSTDGTFTTVAAGESWLSGYTTRTKLTIDQTKVDADLVDFPVLVKLTSANFDFSKANSDGYDIRFTAADGTTLLKYERERHDSANSLAEYWVKVPAVSGTVDTVFYIYYRTTDTADGADPTNVWDTNYKMVQHMKDNTTSQILDSTANANNGTKYAANEPVQTDGKVGKGQSFDGTNDSVNTGNGASLQIVGDKITLSAWFKASVNQSGYPGILVKGTVYGTNTDSYFIRLETGHFNGGIYTSSLKQVSETTLRNDNLWYFGVLAYDGSNIYLYINGNQVGSIAQTGNINGVASSVLIGQTSTTYCFSGSIDEARISNSARTAAWIKASYNAENNTLLTYEGATSPNIARFFLIF
jgi:hypothetical protein